jgi:hypothetical protein
MAGLNLVEVQDIIAEHIIDEFPAYKVYQDYILDEEELAKQDSRIKPYIVISWDGLTRLNSGASFGGVRKDQYVSGFDIGIIAPTPSQCRRGINIIVDKLVGWSYDNVGFLTPGSSTGSFVVAERNNRPHMYMAMAEFSFPMNAVDPGSPILPPNSGS